METPIFDFVQQYQREAGARFHMPGHKGRGALGCEGLDITEIMGADDLHHPQEGGIIARSEQNATALFGTAATYYAAGGSSCCISAMLYLAKLAAPSARKERILAGRNAHKVFLQACGLLGIQPDWLYPDPQDAQGLCGCKISPAALEIALAARQTADALPMAVYLTSPDYLGNVADVAGIAKVCAGYDIPLLVDSAHGAYLKFLPVSQHPMDLGAAICCDSAHKTLPVLTGGAYLHLAKGGIPTADAKAALALFSSTSPSYLILQSLDVCNDYLAGAARAAFAECVCAVEALKASLVDYGYTIASSEPLKLVIDCRPLAQTGEALAAQLHERRVEVEFADPDFVVCMMTPQNTPQEFALLERSLRALPLVLAPQNTTGEITQRGQHTPQPHQVWCTVREALFSTGETVDVENAVGRTCRIASVACPPAIPIVVSGEVITKRDVALFRYYGIETVNVIREDG